MYFSPLIRWSAGATVAREMLVNTLQWSVAEFSCGTAGLSCSPSHQLMLSQPLRGTELAFKLLIHIYAQQIAGIASLCDFHVWLINQAAENALIKPRD